MTDGRQLSLEETPRFVADEFRDTLDHILYVVSEYIEDARTAVSDIEVDFSLKMASRAMRCALQVYGQQLELRAKQKAH